MRASGVHRWDAALEGVDLLAEDGVLQSEARPVRSESAAQGQQVEEQAHAGRSPVAAVDARAEAR